MSRYIITIWAPRFSSFARMPRSTTGSTSNKSLTRRSSSTAMPCDWIRRISRWLQTWLKATTQWLQGVGDGPGNREPGETIMVGGDQMARRVLRSGVPDHVLVGLLVIVPMVSLPQIGSGKFSILFRFPKAAEQTLFLFLP